MKQTKTYLICVLLSVGSGLIVQAQTPPKERWINAAYVKNGMVDTGNSAAKLAVRAGPGMNYEAVDSLASGQKVTSDKAKDGWIRLTSPASAAPAAVAPELWINAAYVKNGTVDTGNASAKLAVRSGPGLNYSQVDSFASGQKVSVVESKNGWVRIAPVTAPIQVAAKPAAQTPAPAAKPARQAQPRQEVAETAVTKPASAPVVVPRPVPVPVRPPIDNLILSGDFSGAALALPTSTGDTTAELSGRWLRSVNSAWEISPYGGNLGPYVRAAASRDAGRLLYVVNDAKRSTGSYVLRFDYILTDASDTLGVKVFVSDSDITVGTDGGNFRMNNPQRPSDMVMLPSGASWATYYLPVELSGGYNYVYVLFIGSGAGNTGIDNVSLSPVRR